MLNDIWFGDCLDLMWDIPAGSIDMILADLPYGNTHNHWDSILPLDYVWDHYRRIIKSNGAIVLFGQGMFSAMLMVSNPSWHRYNMIWRKTAPTGFLNAGRMPLRAHEDLLVFYDRLPTYNPQKTQGHVRKVATARHKRNSKRTTNYGRHGLTSYDSTERYPTTVLTFPLDKQKSALHPTQKPVALCAYLIKTYTNPGQIVLDNVIGSGTTAVAAIETGRQFVGMENDPESYEKAQKRLESVKHFTDAGE